MAINNSPDLYMGGATIFNSQPATQFYLQSMAKKRAKDEALDNYYRDFNKSLNPAGMRNQDIEGWMGKVNEWRGFYQQNKEAIKNPRLDNGKAQSQYMSMYQENLSDTQRSKNAGEISKGYVLPVITNPDKRSRLTDLSLGTIASHDASIYDPNHKELDPTKLDFDAKQFDLNAKKKFTSYITQGVKMDEMVEKTVTDPKTNSKTTTYEYKLNPAALRTIAERAAATYDSDDMLQQHIHDIKDNPELFEQLNQTFKDVYGKDIVSERDFAAAYGLNEVQKEREVQKQTSYNRFLGQSSGRSSNPANNFNFGVSFTNALRTGNKNAATELKNLLSSGNGRLKYMDSFVGNVGGVPMLHIQVREKDPSGFLYDPTTIKIAVDDPSLPNQLTELYQNIMGADVNQEKQQYPVTQEQVVQPRQQQAPPKQTPPKKGTTKKKIAGF